MEQKRKVKSLISKNADCELGFISRFLIFLSCLFVAGTLLLIVFSMSFVEAFTQQNQFKYDKGLDEKQEVLYKLDFVRSGHLQTIKTRIWVDDLGGIDKLYITPTPIVIKKGNLDNADNIGNYSGGKYVNLLGGQNLGVGSDNVSIIGGNNLSVGINNDNATIFGGKGNKMISSSSTVPNIVIGGENNTVKGNNAVILGGKGNKIEGNNSFILGGESNLISEAVSNVIVAGQNVTGNKNNVFVYSNDNNGFTPQTENTFYINVQKGLGINTGNKKRGVNSKGAVSFGALRYGCSPLNSGLLGLSGDSVYGCIGSDKHKLGNVDRDFVSGDGFVGYCTGSDYLRIVESGIERYRSCGSVVGYTNVVFETELLSGVDNNCVVNISAGKNPCVFACTGGYHYFTGTKTCMKDCEIPWNNNVVVHGTVITGYMSQNVQCAQGRTCKTVEKKLTCTDGVWKDGDSVNIVGIYETCTHSENFSCNTAEYEFTNKITTNWTGVSSCTNYKVEGNSCKPDKTYYKGRCFWNHTLTGDGCVTGVDTSNCVCKPDTRMADCILSKLPENTVGVNVRIKQTALNNDKGLWSPSLMQFKYSENARSNENVCTYSCKEGFLYSKKDTKLNIDEGCWTGCELPWTGTMVSHGRVVTGYTCEEGNSSSLEMICNQGIWNSLSDYLSGTDNDSVYDDLNNIIYNKENCN